MPITIKNKWILLTLFAVCVIIVAILAITAYYYTFDKSYNKITGYYVVAKYEDKDQAAQILQKLNDFGLNLMDQMQKKYKNNANSMVLIDRLLNKYDPDKLEENDPIFEFKHKAYTLNFEKIAICLRKKNGEFYDYNTLQFVFLHELSHIASLDREHSDHFWTVFKFILYCAVQLTDYVPVDYSTSPINYCGIDVSHNPYYSDLNIEKYL